MSERTKRPATAPQVYRPQSTPRVLQKKSLALTPITPKANSGTKSAPKAPPVYRPQPVPKVLQRKQASVPNARADTKRPILAVAAITASQVSSNRSLVVQAAMRRTHEQKEKAREEARTKAKKQIKKLNTTEEQLRLQGKTETYPGSQYSEERLQVATGQSKGVAFQTGFGQTTIRYSGTGQVMVSSKQGDYPGSYGKTKFQDYAEWARELDKSPQHRKQFATDILSLMQNNKTTVDQSIYTEEQKRAAAMLITTTSTSEEWRVDGARKLARAALQMIIDHNKTFREAFGDPGIYPMTGGHGTSYTRNLMDCETQKLTDDEVLLLGCMSPLRETDPNGS